MVCVALAAACNAPLRDGEPRARAEALAAPVRAASVTPTRAESTPENQELLRLADVDPDNDEVVAPPGPLAECEAKLAQAGVKFAHADLPLRQQKQGFSCGSEQVVVYRSGPGKIRYNSAPLMTCSMALALAEFELVLQDEAQKRLGKRVSRIEQGGTYNCRRMSRFKNMVSEHSYANAIDLRSFTLSDGQRLSVLRHFGSLTRAPTDVRSLMLRAVARRAFDEGLFSVVLTPYFDNLHRDHFHLDMARYRLDGTR